LDAGGGTARLSVLSFNYLADPLETVVARWRLPENLKTPARVLACCAIFSAAALLLEAGRLHEVRQEEKRWSENYSAQSAAVRDATAFAHRVAKLNALDLEVRRVAESGTKAALKISAIAQALPLDVWLTSITPAEDGLDLEGAAANLDAVRRALVLLNGDPRLGEPRLDRTVASRTSQRSIVRFSMHLGQGTR
jgi:Tfp pilus assembly protein PilN